jgi:hypothetical protein
VTVSTHDDAIGRLDRARGDDGGYGPRPGAPSEPEPTALAALATGDAAARAWLVGRQRDDGSFGIVDGFVRDEGSTALAALALDPGPARERALDRLEALEGARIDDNPAVPVDTSLAGWPWTRDAFGWVDPTGRALLALRLLRPASARIPEGVALLRDRRSVGGGWNYGNRVVLGEELAPFAQTTAIALLGLHGLDDALEREGAARLRQLWREERAGALSVALALATFRLRGDVREAAAVERALADVVARSDLLGDTVAAAWVAIATGPGLRRLEAP